MSTITITKELFFYDEPVVVRGSDVKGKSYLGLNSDEDAEGSIFLFVRVKEDVLAAFCAEKVDLRYALTEGRVGRPFLGHTAGFHGLEVNLKAAKGSVDRYLPKAGFFIKAGQGITSRREERAIKIDGRWGLEDLRKFSDLLQDSYAFVYAVKTEDKNITSDMRSLFHRYPWRGGFSSLNFFEDVYRTIPANDQAAIKRIQYASPGAMIVDANPEVADYLRDMISGIVSSDVTKEFYRSTREELKKLKLLGTSARDISLTPGTHDYLLGVLKSMAQRLMLSDRADHILDLGKGDPLAAVKIYLAFYRKLDALSRYVKTGKARDIFIEPSLISPERL
jgi:hypothetical protein